MIVFPAPRLVVVFLLVVSAVSPPILSAPTSTAAPSAPATQENGVANAKPRSGLSSQQTTAEEEELALLKGAKIQSHGQAEAAVVPGGMTSVNVDSGAAGDAGPPVLSRSQRRSHSETIANNEVDPGSGGGGGGGATLTYTPLDMAEYVFSTGDERSVTAAIEDLLQQGAMSPEEAITFLQQMRFNLIYLQAQYAQEQRMQEQRQQMHSKRNQQHGHSAGADLPDGISGNVIPEREGGHSDGTASQKEYNDLVSRLKMADMLYTEYSLEEVIYQLAKAMFTQSLAQGSTESQRALHKFTMFLESEAKQGRISRQLERKVLDVMLASLSDTLSEHPELVTAARNGLVTEDVTDAALAASGAAPSIVGTAPPFAPVAPLASATAPFTQTSNAATRLLRQLLQLAPELAPSPPSQRKQSESVSGWSESGLVKSAEKPAEPEQLEDAGVRQLHALKMNHKPSSPSVSGASISSENHRSG